MAMKKKTLPLLSPKIFDHEQFGQCRFIMRDREPWFVATDICRALEIKQPTKALSRLDDDEKGVTTIHTLGGPQQMLIVSEPGLYRLIFTSRKPEARQFQRWVTHEVLPSIRKYGYYVAPHQRIITIEGKEKLKAFKAQYPEGSVEVKSISFDFDEKDNGEYDDITIYEVVLHLNGTEC